jgi:hypothetical protein
MAETVEGPDEGGSNTPLVAKLPQRVTLTDTLVVASVPVLAYVLHFTYTAGYVTAFGLPTALIEFNLNDLFVAIAALAMLGFTVYFFGDAAFSLVRDLKEPIREACLRVFGAYVFFIALFMLLTPTWGKWLPALAVLVLLSLLEFGMPLITQCGKGSYLEKLRAWQQKRLQREADTSYVSPVTRLVRFLGPGVILIPIAAYLVFQAGRASAVNATEFRVASTSPESVVLYMTDSKLVVAPFDRTTQTIESCFTIIPISDNPGLADIQFRLEKVGPLSVVTITSTPSPTATPSPSATSTQTLAPMPSPGSPGTSVPTAVP